MASRALFVMISLPSAANDRGTGNGLVRENRGIGSKP
jgi:hypothetical protein